MRIETEHEEGEDFGSVVLHLDAEDWFRIQGEREGGIELRFSVWNHEAADFITALEPIASTPEMA